MRLTRQNAGVLLLFVSLVYSAFALTKRFHPMWLRMRAHAGVERLLATVLGALTFKAALLVIAALMAFWPERRNQ